MSFNEEMMRLGIELKFHEKQLERSAAKLQTEYKQKDKLLVASMKSGNHEKAKIYAEAMVRIKGDIKSRQILAAKVSGMRLKLTEARMTQQLTMTLTKAYKSLQESGVLPAEGVAKVVDAFESATEKLEVMESMVDQTLAKAANKYQSADEVDALIALVADENALELGALLPQVSARVKQKEPEEEEDELDLPSVPIKKPNTSLAV